MRITSLRKSEKRSRFLARTAKEAKNYLKEGGMLFLEVGIDLYSYELKNGTKIFEGDIVQGKDRLEKHLEVFGYIDHKNGSFVITGDFMTHYRWLDYEVEVIGNIHDNPELMEVE